jgi:hypothetical protein
MNNGIRVVNGGMQPQKEEPSYEESVRFQAKLIGLWEQQQSVLGYTAYSAKTEHSLRMSGALFR